jgi:hypothetical protein
MKQVKKRRERTTGYSINALKIDELLSIPVSSGSRVTIFVGKLFIVVF